VYGISALLLVSAGALVALIRGSMRVRVIAAAVIAAPWLIAPALAGIEWTQPSGKPVAIAVAQGAIPQQQKWLESNHDHTLNLYRKLAEEGFGILRADVKDEREQYYNSVLALGEQVQWYDKSHLVPFAEFFPVPDFVRSWLRLMSLPYSDFTRGGTHQPPLRAGGLKLAMTICYEDGYGSSQLPALREADTLVNVTNDAWFGHGAARHQHLQLARMRAMEAQRYMIRAANDGISGVIGPHGEIIARAPEFQPFLLHSAVTPRIGLTLYARVGNWLVISLATLGIAISVAMKLLAARRRKTLQTRNLG
jgi:apolipoprotein N-acyltransferase